MQDEEPDAAGSPAETDRQDEQPARRPVRGLGGLGCLTMVLAAAAAIALLYTGDFYAGVAGIAIFAVAVGVGLWLYNVASAGKK